MDVCCPSGSQSTICYNTNFGIHGYGDAGVDAQLQLMGTFPICVSFLQLTLVNLNLPVVLWLNSITPTSTYLTDVILFTSPSSKDYTYRLGVRVRTNLSRQRRNQTHTRGVPRATTTHRKRKRRRTETRPIVQKTYGRTAWENAQSSTGTTVCFKDVPRLRVEQRRRRTTNVLGHKHHG